MKQLEKAVEYFGHNEFVKLDSNRITFTIQDGTIPEIGVNGIQASEMLFFLRLLFNELNSAVPCRENALTITHLDEAWHWQLRRDMERKSRKVEGTQKP
jgi:hypothetical protein